MLFASLSNQETALLMNALFSSEYFYWNVLVRPNNTVAHHVNQMVFFLASASKKKIAVHVKSKDKLPCLATGLIYRAREQSIITLKSTGSGSHIWSRWCHFAVL